MAELAGRLASYQPNEITQPELELPTENFPEPIDTLPSFERGVVCLVADPVIAAAETGGATYEPAKGWWTYVTNPTTALEFGNAIADARNALYIPTKQKDGTPVDPKLILQLAQDASIKLGLENITSALGIWISHETGEPQIEHIWILHGPPAEGHFEELRKAAMWICNATKQESVCLETGGELFIIETQQSTTQKPCLHGAYQ